MTRKYHNHTLHNNPKQHEEEAKNNYSQMTPRRKQKLSNQLSLLQRDNHHCKTRMDTKQIKKCVL